MKNKLMINHKDRLIVMDRTFAMHAMNTMSDEYEHLQRVRTDYPKYEVIQRHIRQNEQKKTYKGLTYEYMEDYIMTHGSSEQVKANLKEFYDKRLIAECHGKAYRYPVIKRWFLEKYPEIVEHGAVDVLKPAKVIEVFGEQDEEAQEKKKVHKGSGIDVLLMEGCSDCISPGAKNGRRHMASVRLDIYGTIGEDLESQREVQMAWASLSVLPLA